MLYFNQPDNLTWIAYQINKYVYNGIYNNRLKYWEYILPKPSPTRPSNYRKGHIACWMVWKMYSFMRSAAEFTLCHSRVYNRPNLPKPPIELTLEKVVFPLMVHCYFPCKFSKQYTYTMMHQREYLCGLRFKGNGRSRNTSLPLL